VRATEPGTPRAFFHGLSWCDEIAPALGRTKAAIASRCSIYFSGAPCDIKYSDLNEAHLNPFLTGKIGGKPHV